MSITDFLNARIAEDEAVARAIGEHSGRSWRTHHGTYIYGLWVVGDMQRGDAAEHVARHDPARVLAECAAKRAIVELHRNNGADWDLAYCAVCEDKVMHAAHDWPCPTIRTLAAVYADHPAYLDEWRVGV